MNFVMINKKHDLIKIWQKVNEKLDEEMVKLLNDVLKLYK